MRQINMTNSVAKLTDRSSACFLLKYSLKNAFRPINCDLYAYAVNNPLRYIDPDGRFIFPILSSYKKDIGVWGNANIGKSQTAFGAEGCVVTGIANVVTTNNYRLNSWFKRDFLSVNPGLLNSKDIYCSDYQYLDCVDWNKVSDRTTLNISRSEHGNHEAAQKMVLDACVSPKGKFLLVRVPITTRQGISYHWVNTDGRLTGLPCNGPLTKEDSGLWIKVGPTSQYDNSSRTRNSNWKVGSDGLLYVKVKSVIDAATLEP